MLNHGGFKQTARVKWEYDRFCLSCSRPNTTGSGLPIFRLSIDSPQEMVGNVHCAVQRYESRENKKFARIKTIPRPGFEPRTPRSKRGVMILFTIEAEAR